MKEIPYEEDRRPMYELHYEALKTLAKRNSYIPWKKEFLQKDGYSEAPPIEKRTIAKDECFLGFSSKEYSLTNVVTAKIMPIKFEGGRWRPDPKIILIIAPKGAGKTSLMRVIGLDNFVARLGLPTYIPDSAPNPEWYTSKYPITKTFPDRAEQITNFYSTWEAMPNEKWTPKGYSGVVYKPKFSSEGYKEEGTDKYLLLTLQDFRDLFRYNPTEAETALLNMTDEEESKPSRYYTNAILQNKIVKVETFSETMKLKDNEELKAKYGEGASFFRSIGYMLDNGALGDIVPENQNIIKDMKENNFVVLRGISTREEGESKVYAKYQAYSKIFFTKIINDRMSFVSGTPEEKKRSYLNHEFGFQVIADEFDKLAPAKGFSYLRGLFKSGSLKERKNHMTIIGASQDISLIDPEIVKSADIIFFARPSSGGDGKEKNGTMDYIEKNLSGLDDSIKALDWQDKETNNLGINVKQWKAVFRNGKAFSFYPNISRSAIK